MWSLCSSPCIATASSLCSLTRVLFLGYPAKSLELALTQGLASDRKCMDMQRFHAFQVMIFSRLCWFTYNGLSVWLAHRELASFVL